jgi:3-oxoacyl-(acyl-carrier-protein) synthase/acyl carrier protein/GNAT superfamily N-acetyltransferase
LEPIAIIGASCRFPGASGLAQFWQLLREGKNAVSTVPKDRWDPEALYDADLNAPGKISTRFGGFISGIREFDCAFFGISPREAASMDPQQRLLLETAYEAFEDAGLAMSKLAGSQTGVYVGIGPGDYGRMCVESWDEVGSHYATGNFLSTAADRIPYFFDLRGPSMAVDTACSSSLVAVHLACRSLECGDAMLALAGGVNALLSPPLSISLGKAGALSPTGRCRAFDADADGYVRGEGAGFVVLKKLAEAITDGDRIYAVIRGSAINQSGRRNGLTAPGSWGEENVMASAWRSSGLAPLQAGYVEAHGTGTVLGDAIEAGALGKVFGSGRNGLGPCRIGSVKTNFGHLETAAGIAGLLKLVLMVWHGEFVPSLYPETPNPHVNVEQLGLTVQMRTESWQATANSPRVGGVSSFGLGGTYAHVCVTSAESRPEISPESAVPGLLVPISARHPVALRALVREFSKLFDQADAPVAIEICRAAAHRRSHHEYRAAFAGLSASEVAMAMEWWLRDAKAGTSKAGSRRKLVAIDRDQSDGPLLNRLRDWGIQPHRILCLVGGQLFDTESSAKQSVIEWGSLGTPGEDLLNLTGGDLPSRFAQNARIILGPSSSEDADLTALRVASELYELGYPLAWQRIYPGKALHVSLPSYPWQRQTCWWRSEETEAQRSSNKTAPATLPAQGAPRKLASLPAGGLQKFLARLTKRPLAEIQPEAVLADLGIDSLMTLELQAELQREFGISLPVETLVTAGSVGELERLVGESVKQAAPQPENQSTQVHASIEQRSAPGIREATLADYPKIAALVLRNGLEIKSQEEWEHLWTGNPVYQRVTGWPLGWVVESGGDVAGFLGNIPVSYSLNGREIIGASLHSFALDPSHRGHGLLLLQQLLTWGKNVDYLLGTTANESSSQVLERSGVSPVPVGDWENAALWITHRQGFVHSALQRKGLPKALSYPAQAGLAVRDMLLRSGPKRAAHEVKSCTEFDERFDTFWDELQRTYPARFLANRSREVLQWHFKFALAKDRAWIVTVEDGPRIVAYAIFSRCDNPALNLTRVRLVDLQYLNEDAKVIASFLSWGVRKCREESIHMLEAFGFRPDKQRVIDRLAPHRRKLGSWLYFHAIRNVELQRELLDQAVWDPSALDGDASL